MGNNNSKRQPSSPRINFPCFTTLILVGESQYLYNHLTLGYVLIFMLHTVFLPQHIPPLGKKQKAKRIISHFLWAGKKSSLKGSQEQFNIGATALSILCIHCSPAEGRSLVYKGICFSQVGLTSPNYSISCGITKKTAAEKKKIPHNQTSFFKWTHPNLLPSNLTSMESAFPLSYYFLYTMMTTNLLTLFLTISLDITWFYY